MEDPWSHKRLYLNRRHPEEVEYEIVDEMGNTEEEGVLNWDLIGCVHNLEVGTAWRALNNDHTDPFRGNWH